MSGDGVNYRIQIRDGDRWRDVVGQSNERGARRRAARLRDEGAEVRILGPDGAEVELRAGPGRPALGAGARRNVVIRLAPATLLALDVLAAHETRTAVIERLILREYARRAK